MSSQHLQCVDKVFHSGNLQVDTIIYFVNYKYFRASLHCHEGFSHETIKSQFVVTKPGFLLYAIVVLDLTSHITHTVLTDINVTLNNLPCLPGNVFFLTILGMFQQYLSPHFSYTED